MPDINRLREKGSALGFSFHRGTRRGDGYVLVNDTNGDKPLGDSYTASLADIDRHLSNVADDVGIDEVDIGNDNPKSPPTNAELQRSLKGHPDSGKIKNVLEPPPSTKQDQRQRIALDRLVSSGLRTNSRMALERASEAEQKQHLERLRAALEEEEKIKATQLPKSTLPLREIGINADHHFAKEKARQGRVFRKAEQRLKTNIASRRDRGDWGYRDYCSQEEYEEIWWRERNFLAPDSSTSSYDAPVAPVRAAKVEHARPHNIPKAERLRRQRLLELRGAILGAIARKDHTTAGARLEEVKELLGHGPFIDWVKREIGISVSTAERHMAKAKARAP